MQRICQRCEMIETSQPFACALSSTGVHVWLDVPTPEPTTPSVRNPTLDLLAESKGARIAKQVVTEAFLAHPFRDQQRTERPSFRLIFSDFALALSRRSTCARLQVGCVIAARDYRQVFSIGYNGNVAGGKNDCDRHGPEAVGNCGCLHAEQNAVINCTAPRFAPKVVFVTHLPCVTCSKFLINLGGVESVYYRNDYRIKDSLQLFDAAGIRHEMFP